MEATKATLRTPAPPQAPVEQHYEEIDEQPAPAAAPANVAPVVVDKLGRKLILRELTLLQETDLIAAMPAAHSGNAMLLGRALLAARVAKVDGADCHIPMTQTLYRAMLQKIGKEGISAVIASEPQPASDDGEDAQVTLAKN